MAVRPYNPGVSGCARLSITSTEAGSAGLFATSQLRFEAIALFRSIHAPKGYEASKEVFTPKMRENRRLFATNGGVTAEFTPSKRPRQPLTQTLSQRERA